MLNVVKLIVVGLLNVLSELFLISGDKIFSIMSGYHKCIIVVFCVL
jgi:hypothetical protein